MAGFPPRRCLGQRASVLPGPEARGMWSALHAAGDTMGGKCTCWVIHSSAWWPLTGCRAGLLRMLLPCELQAMELRPGDRRGLCAQALHLGQAGGQEIGCFIALWNWPVVFAWDGLFLGSQPLPPPGGRTPGLVYRAVGAGGLGTSAPWRLAIGGRGNSIPSWVG